MEQPISRTCLYYSHVTLGAKMEPFAGFSMPIQYQGIIEEHQAVRNAAGMFDVSHMGEIFVSGPDAEKYVNYLFTNDVMDMPEGKVLYGMMLRPDGGVVDDLLVYRLFGGKGFLLVVNAANIAKDAAWACSLAEKYDVTVENLSEDWGEVALQGPEAGKIMLEVLGLDMQELVFYTFTEVRWKGYRLTVSRTGYTGEDGFELYGTPEAVCHIWKTLLDAGVQPCGLGCRDTLRFEAGLPLYGHELSDSITPVEAGLGMFVKTDKGDFCGRDAVVRQKSEGVSRKVIGIELSDKAIPRAGYPVFAGGEQIGHVTTGYRSISTGKSICMALVSADYAALGTSLEVEIHRKRISGTVCKKRFYRTSYKK